MGAVCPSRSNASKVDGMAAKLVHNLPANTSPGKSVESKVSCQPAPLPTKTWRTLLEEASLNADAAPFPEIAGPPGLTRPSYNQKHDETPQFKRVARNPRTSGPSAELAPLADGLRGAGTGMTLQTQTYMQLLKDGSSKKKHAMPARNKDTKQTGRNGPLQPSRGFLEPGALISPMTTAGLKQTWQSALKSQDEEGERALPRKIVRDDTDLEKLSADLDRSDLVYWSDTESTDKQRSRSKASAHRLGRRQALATIPSYVMQDLSYGLDKLVGAMLARLQQFGEQQQIFYPDGAPQRRLVIGLKEVARRVKQMKVSCLIVAPDLESDSTEGGLDDRIREVLGMCYEKDIPVIFALSRACLGQALGKTMNVSLLGVLDTTGAKQLFEAAVNRATKARQAWLRRLPGK
jgi:ribosomal protein L7Ae-like RNA K-turn-binding protein|mmetsp:Transcript_69709/g.110569  ORF Transcript_69709/g.110569 Transcript_69709/m.110569 type:complete len:405 (+) Transcript_69709:135-1349(+)